MGNGSSTVVEEFRPSSRVSSLEADSKRTSIDYRQLHNRRHSQNSTVTQLSTFHGTEGAFYDPGSAADEARGASDPWLEKHVHSNGLSPKNNSSFDPHLKQPPLAAWSMSQEKMLMTPGMIAGHREEEDDVTAMPMSPVWGEKKGQKVTKPNGFFSPGSSSPSSGKRFDYNNFQADHGSHPSQREGSLVPKGHIDKDQGAMKSMSAYEIAAAAITEMDSLMARPTHAVSSTHLNTTCNGLHDETLEQSSSQNHGTTLGQTNESYFAELEAELENLY